LGETDVTDANREGSPVKVLLIGSTGHIGRAVARALTARQHTVLGASRSNPDRPIDLSDPASIARLLDDVGRVDAIACAAGHAAYGLVNELTRDQYLESLTNKALGQIELVRRGLHVIAQRGSFTSITSVLAHRPVPTSSAASAANGAVESFAAAAALELAPVRVNVVSPTLVAMVVSSSGVMRRGGAGRR
jgi:NAD(P)-dependent dehydrogenase (short-subunit alcohol dehydrogenase family)